MKSKMADSLKCMASLSCHVTSQFTCDQETEQTDLDRTYVTKEDRRKPAHWTPENKQIKGRMARGKETWRILERVKDC